MTGEEQKAYDSLKLKLAQLTEKYIEVNQKLGEKISKESNSESNDEE